MATAADYDVFVSYAHLDNGPRPPEEEGWITRFHATLEDFLGQRLGRQVRIWRDDKLQGNDVFADEITERFGTAALLVSILSPRYVKSEWCRREIEEFCARAEQAGGLRVDNKLRVFKILKLPVTSQDQLPRVVAETTGYEFFIEKDGVALTLDSAFGKDLLDDYNFMVAKVAAHATVLLETLEAAGRIGSQPSRQPSTQPNGVPAAPATTVYLAQCSHDLRGERERLASALEQHRCTVLPDRHLPAEVESEYCEQVAAELARCRLSIHLVGTSYGMVPDGPSRRSTVHLQNDLAVQRCRDGELERLIWLPDGESADEQQREFTRSLHEDADAQFGADLITGDMEELKTAMHATLDRLSRPKPPPPAATADGDAAGDADGDHDGDGAGASTERRIYLICVEQDRKATVPLRRYLKQAGFDVETPAFEGSAAAVRKANQDLLKACAAVLVYYGAGDKPWRLTIDNELKRAAGYRDGRPLAALGTVLAEPDTGDKQDLVDMEEPDLIDARAGFDERTLHAFLESLRGAGGGS